MGQRQILIAAGFFQNFEIVDARVTLVEEDGLHATISAARSANSWER